MHAIGAQVCMHEYACRRRMPSKTIFVKNSTLLAAPEAIYTHSNISNGFFNSTYLSTPTPDPSTVFALPASRALMLQACMRQ